MKSGAASQRNWGTDFFYLAVPHPVPHFRSSLWMDGHRRSQTEMDDKTSCSSGDGDFAIDVCGHPCTSMDVYGCGAEGDHIVPQPTVFVPLNPGEIRRYPKRYPNHSSHRRTRLHRRGWALRSPHGKLVSPPVNYASLMLPSSEYVGAFLATFEEFPPSQRAASFTIDQALDSLKSTMTALTSMK